MERESWSVPGIHCTNCGRTIETELRAVDGVVEVRADVDGRNVEIAWSPPADRAQLLALLDEIGFPAGSDL